MHSNRLCTCREEFQFYIGKKLEGNLDLCCSDFEACLLSLFL